MPSLFVKIWFQLTFLPGWPWTTVLSLSAYQVAENTGVSHCTLLPFVFFKKCLFAYHCSLSCFEFLEFSIHSAYQSLNDIWLASIFSQSFPHMFSYHSNFFFHIFWGWNSGAWPQSLALAMQVLCHLSQASSPICNRYFGNRVSLLACKDISEGLLR
jgi:hypothetical protein